MKLSARGWMKNFIWSALAVAAITSQTEAAPKPRADEPALVAVAADALPNLIPDGSLADLALSLERELGACRQLPQEETRDFAGRSVTRREWCTDTLNGLLQIAKSSRDFTEVNQLLRTRFDWFQSTGRAGSRQVLFTAYYFPVIQATPAPKNSTAESKVKDAIEKAKRNKQDVLILSAGMAQRSFSVDEITELYLAYDGGDAGEYDH
jgi:membrane-bound lytic murein transglycosylase